MGTESGKQNPDTFTGIGGRYRREFPGGPRKCVSQGTMPTKDAPRDMEGTSADFLDGSTAAEPIPDIQTAE